MLLCFLEHRLNLSGFCFSSRVLGFTIKGSSSSWKEAMPFRRDQSYFIGSEQSASKVATAQAKR
jgi:hypothetical protein